MPAIHFQNVAEILVSGAVNGVVEGALIALCGWLLMRIVRHSSSTRFAILLATLGAVAAFPILHSALSASTFASTGSFALHLPASWAIDILAVWAVIAVLALAKIGFGFWQIHKLRQSCIELNAEHVHPDLNSVIAGKLRRRIAICASDRVRVPAAIGFFKPTIVIPTWAIRELTSAEIKTVILHELAHLRRWDDWTNLAQKVVSALLFFHPAIWWIGRGLAREREMACDDFVLAATADHRGYARCLVSVAEKSFLRRGLALAQAMAERMQLTAQRVARILHGVGNADASAGTRIWKPVGIVAAVSAVCLVSLAHEPRLVAFDNAVSNGAALAVASPSFNAKVIPAAFRTNENSVVAVERNHTRMSHAKPMTLTHRAPVPVVVAHNHQPVANVINARLNARVAPPHAVLVIMQTDGIDARGRVWSVSVWQLTVYHRGRSANQPLEKGVPPKST
jgi:beta-lactamase regulating signal transducer with metallopeptidase domain